MVLTSGYILMINIDEFSNIIMNLHKSGVAGLFIKLKRFFDKLPDDVIKLANELNFPIVEVPMHLAFIEVINPTLLQIIDHQSERLRFSEEIHKTFTNLVINNEDTQTIVNTLSEMLNKDILYYDLHFQKAYYSKNPVDISKEIMSLELKDILETHLYYTIGLNKEIYGYIICLNKKDTDFSSDDYNILTHANTVLILDVQKKISSMQIEDRHKNEFVLDLIMNNIKYEEEVKNRSNIFGWDFTNDICVMVVDIDNFKEKYLKLENKNVNDNLEDIKERIFKYTTYILKAYFNDAIYATFSDSIVFLLQPDIKNIKMLGGQLQKTGDEIRDAILKNFEFTVMVGVITDDLVKAFGMNATQIANLGAMYFYAYTIMQIPSGILADYLGPKKTVVTGCIVAFIGSGIFSFAVNIPMAYIGRLLVGLGVSVVFLCLLKIQSKRYCSTNRMATELSGISAEDNLMIFIFCVNSYILLS